MFIAIKSRIAEYLKKRKAAAVRLMINSYIRSDGHHLAFFRDCIEVHTFADELWTIHAIMIIRSDYDTYNRDTAETLVREIYSKFFGRVGVKCGYHDWSINRFCCSRPPEKPEPGLARYLEFP
jgi:hypothetical protein